VSDLTINRPGVADIGLIDAAIGDSVIRDVGLVRGSITGGLLGSNTTGTISDNYATGAIESSYAKGTTSSGGCSSRP
jgi:hypothetical protein